MNESSRRFRCQFPRQRYNVVAFLQALHWRVTLRSVPFSECLIFGVQSTQDVYIVAYYNTGVTSLNTSSPGGVQLINPGTSGGTLCADVYVFDPAEELKECALPISTDGGLF